MKPNTVGRVDGTGPIRPYAPFRTLSGGIPTGTIVLSQDGEIPVEYLCEGDRVVTRHGGLVPLRRLHVRTVDSRAILIAAGSLGDTRPECNLTVPEDQTILLRDWRAQAMFGRAQALATAGQLVDGEFIRDLGRQRMELFQLEFDTPQVIYAGRLELGCSAPEFVDLRASA